VLGGKIVDREFHADFRNPIPAIRPWRSTPLEIDVAPRGLAQGKGGTVKITARRGFDKFHKAMWDGRELETRFVSATELEAVIPAEMTKTVGTYPITVVGQGDFASRSAPAYFIVSY
jgi:hypothetical protein